MELQVVYNKKTRTLYNNSSIASYSEKRSMYEIVNDTDNYMIIEKRKLAEMLLNKEIEVEKEFR